MFCSGVDMHTPSGWTGRSPGEPATRGPSPKYLSTYEMDQTAVGAL